MMKRLYFHCPSLLVALHVGMLPIAAVAGELQPPAGPISSTMKTLTEVEPRTPISSLPYHITGPGSYYLTENLSNENGSLYIEASHVAVDLNGFTIFSTGDRDAVVADSEEHHHITVKNGNVSSDGTGRGVFLRGSHQRIENIHVSNALYDGVGIQGDSNFILNCHLEGCGSNGIHLWGSGTVIRSCIVIENANDGIRAWESNVIANCSSTANGGDGIHALNSLIVGNVAVGNSGDNIYGYQSTLVNNHAP